MDLPPLAGNGPLLRPALLAAGVTDEEVRRLRRSRELATIAPGAYVASTDPRLRDPTAVHALLVAASLDRIAPDAVVSHESAAVLHGLPLWRPPPAPVHVTRPRRTSGGRTARLHVHTAPLRPEEITVVGGVRVTSVARTVVDLARTLPFEQAVVVADGALRRRPALSAELEEALARAARWPGSPGARRCLGFADGRSESVGESRSRVAIARVGLPPPVPQWEVDLRGGRARADFGWPDLATVGEFDGRVKYGRLLRPGQDPGEVVYAEKLREDAIRATGLWVVRWTWAELDDFGAVAARISGAARCGGTAAAGAAPPL